MAGACGVDPEPLSYRRLHFRYLGAVTERWDHTAALQATIYSVAGGKMVHPKSIHPYRRAIRSAPVTKREAKETAAELRAILKGRARRE